MPAGDPRFERSAKEYCAHVRSVKSAPRKFNGACPGGDRHSAKVRMIHGGSARARRCVRRTAALGTNRIGRAGMKRAQRLVLAPNTYRSRRASARSDFGEARQRYVRLPSCGPSIVEVPHARPLTVGTKGINTSVPLSICSARISAASFKRKREWPDVIPVDMVCRGCFDRGGARQRKTRVCISSQPQE